MQKRDDRPTASDFIFHAVWGAVDLTLVFWLLDRGSYVAAGLVAVASIAVEVVVLESRWDWALVVRHGGDERQKRVADRAGRVAFLVLLGICLVGAMVEMSEGGNPSTFAFMAGVAIAAYLVSVAVLVRRS